MIKKYSKLILVAICAFFICMTPSFAREFTKEEFAEYLQKLEEEEGEYIDNFYLVGEYVFTNRMQFTTQDAMLAARSIKVKDTNGKINTDAIYGEMTIHLFQHRADASGNYVVRYDRNPIGTTAEPSKLNVKYIDYEFVPDESKAEITPADSYTHGNITFENDENLTHTTTKKVITLGGEIYENKDIDETIFSKENLTGFYYAFTVKVDNLTDDTTVKVEGVINQTFGKSDFNENGELVVLMPLDPNLDAMGKNIIIKVDSDGTSNPEYGETIYEINYQDVKFKKVLDVDATIEENMDKVETDKFSATLSNGTLSVEQKDVTESLSNSTGKGLIDALKETLKTPGVESVKLTYNGVDYALTEDNIESEVAKLLAVVAGKDYDKAIQNDVIGKAINMTVELESGNVTTVTPDGKSSVEYTIDFTGNKAKETGATVLVDKNDAAYTDAVKEFLENIKFNMLDTDLKLVDGKLTGTILRNDNVGNDFSSIPEDITGYYFTYVIRLDENATDETTVTLPGNGGTKVVGKPAFDTPNSIVVAHALNPNADKKVFEIVVDLDGEGSEYLPTTFVIDYSGVQFLTAEDMLKLATNNVAEFDKVKSALTISAETKEGISSVTTAVVTEDSTTNVSYTVLTSTTADGEEKVYQYETEKDGYLYVYQSLDNASWYYSKFPLPADGATDDESLVKYLFGDYKSVVRVDSDIEGTIKLAVTTEIDPVEVGEEDGEKIYYTPVRDAVEYVYIKDKELSKIDIDMLAIFDDEIQAKFNAFTSSNSIEAFNGTVTIPQSVINSAVEIPVI